MSSTNLANIRHPYHLVDPSPQPFVISFALLMITTGTVFYMHGLPVYRFVLPLGIAWFIWIFVDWFRAIVQESTFMGYHTEKVQFSHRTGIKLFIASEVMFFFSFFWAFFASSLSPSIWIFQQYPPEGIDVISPWGIPLANTVILLSSGATVTWSHYAIRGGELAQAIYSLQLTIILAIIFTALQGFEYVHASFTISDSIFGTCFYMLTGFHGFHVIVGTIWLTVCLFRMGRRHFKPNHHIGYEGAIWYWHFVDVVWLFLFVVVYWWGGR
jgi:heme/copper-type cytochrome/quinol oxidase subunit 3